MTRTGNSAITTLTDGSAKANVAIQNYDQIVKAALTIYPWKWATKTATLALLSGTPAPPWRYAYQLPTDLLKLRVVTVEGAVVDYERQFDKLLCDQDASRELIAKYTWAVPESYWPGVFAEAVTQHLEVLFLRGLGERYQEAVARVKEARNTLLLAKAEDSKDQTTRDPWISPTLAARNGSGGRRIIGRDVYGRVRG